MNQRTYTRRVFLQQGMSFASMVTTAPLFIQRSALGMVQPAGAATSSRPGVPEDRVLVVLQFGGGNDGLNTVVPYGRDAYYTSRPSLSIPAPGRGTAQRPAALPLDGADGIGLHPAFAGFKDLMDEGAACIVQGVGYPNPNRSHFTSMDIWHTADSNASGYGWIGKYFDCTCTGTPGPQSAIAIGRTAPLALRGAQQSPVTFDTPGLFRWTGEDLHPALDDPYRKINRAGALDAVNPLSQQAFLMRTALDAQESSDHIRAAVAKRPLVQYPRTRIARQLRMVGSMIRAEMPTRVYYVSLGGFDTHAAQSGPQANLLRQAGDALNAFYRDLTAQGAASRVLTMVFSEFGRRVRQNASGGTDHGTAAPMYFVGDMVKPGLLGRHPSLTDLDNGDLVYNVDFRSVYAAVLEDWMGAPSQQILGRAYRRFSLFKPRA